MLLQFTDKGIYCPRADIYIDPWSPVRHAVITHAHSDHARPGMQRYLCHHDTLPVLRLRLGADIQAHAVAYGEVIRHNGVSISLHPAGHIPGSAQVRVESQGEIWVVTGDYKLVADGLSEPFEPVRCHHLVTESTFGLPVYRFPDPAEVATEINGWWRQNAAEGFRTVILGYALGKSQTILHHLDQSIGRIYWHGAVANVNQALEEAGYHFPGERLLPGPGRSIPEDAIIVAPPSVLGTPWLRNLSPYRTGLCSGWMQLRGTRRRYGVDRGFVLSDHGDWGQLNEAILASHAGTVYVTHGYEQAMARWIRESLGLEAHEVHTYYHEGEREEI